MGARSRGAHAAAVGSPVSPFWRFWTASAISLTGSSVTAVALPLVALLLLDASPLEVGVVAGASYAGWLLLGLPAGPICQVLPLRAVQVVCDLLRALAVASIPVAWFLDALTLPHLVVAALVVSLCTVLFEVSNSTFLPAICTPDELTSKNSWMSGMHSTTLLAGPSGAGLLIQVLGPAAAMVLDAVSYLGSALILRTLPEHVQPRSAEPPRMVAMIRAGWGFVVRERLMRTCLLDGAASNFVGGALVVLVPVYLVSELGVSPWLLGLLLATEGLGGLLGAALTSRLSARIGSARAAVLASVWASVLVMLLPLASSTLGLLLFALGNLGYAAGTVVTAVTTRTYRQVASPPELLSRVVATMRFVGWGVIPLGSICAGALAGAVGAQAAMWVFCALSWLSPLVLLASPMRRMRDLDPRMVPAPRGSRRQARRQARVGQSGLVQTRSSTVGSPPATGPSATPSLGPTGSSVPSPSCPDDGELAGARTSTAEPQTAQGR